MTFTISRDDLKKSRTFGRDRDQALADATGLNVEALGAPPPPPAPRPNFAEFQRPVFQPAPDDFAATGVSEADINARRVQYITPDMVKAQAETIFRREYRIEDRAVRMEDVLQPEQIADILLRAEGEVRQNAANPSFLAGLGALGETADAAGRPVRTFVDEFGQVAAELGPTAPLALIDDLRNRRLPFGDTRRFLSDPGAIGEGLDRTHKEVSCKLWDRKGLDAPAVSLSRDGKRRLVAPPWRHAEPKR